MSAHQLPKTIARSRAKPRRPTTKSELDIIKERNQFIRASDVDPATLSWEDSLTLKYYETLFREYALVSLKHYSSGAIGLRWRTETEVLAGTGHLTCGSLRCEYHTPPPDADEPDPESAEPLVNTRLDEFEVPFSYVEGGSNKSALVKLVLCRSCGKKLRRAREVEGKQRAPAVEKGDAGRDRRTSRDSKGRRDEPKRTNPDDDDDDYRPSLPPDMSRDSRPPPSRRSASPEYHW